MPDLRPTNAAEFRRHVCRMAPYRPFSSELDQVDYACRQFVLAAAHENSGRLASCEECQAVCETLWGVTLGREEIFAVIKSLVRDGQLLRETDDSLRLSPATSKELAERIRGFNEVEATAFVEWESMVARLAPSLDRVHKACLRDDLTAWIHHIVGEYGVEAALLLFPKDPRYGQFLARLDNLGLDFLPERDPSVALVRKEALREFATGMTAIQRQFFGCLLTTAHLMSVFTFDPAALEHVQDLIRGQLLFLDTNIVYSVLRLAGPRKYLAAMDVLDLSKRLGYKLCVTPWTVTEMQESVRNAYQRLMRQQPSPQDLADIPADMSDSDAEEIFVRAFRVMERDNGITIQDFVSLHEQVEALLANVGIDVIALHCDEIEESDAIEEHIRLLEGAREGLEEKPRPLQEHDVKHRLLVARIRGPEKRQFANAGCMFITNDNAVKRYARIDLRDGELPFASSLDDWATIVRNLIPRTTDYDRTLRDLLDTPLFCSAPPISSSEVSSALARISAFEEHPPVVHTRVLVDSAISFSADGNDREGEKSEVAPREDTTTLGARLQESREILASERAEHDRSMAALRATLAAEHRDLIDSNRERGILLEEVASLRKQVDELHSLASKVKAAPDGNVVPAALESDSDIRVRLARQEQMTAALIIVLCTVAGIMVLLVPLGTGWISGGWSLIGDIVVAASCFLGAYASRFGFRRAIAAVTAVATLLTIVAAIQAFVT